MINLNQITNAPGTLKIISGIPNPSGVSETQLFLIQGDVTSGPIHSINNESGIEIPRHPGFLKENEFTLSIFHLNDLHDNLMSFTPDGEQSILSRMAWQIKTTREKYRNNPNKAVLVFGAGDDCIGSIFDELLGDGKLENFKMHASYRTFSALGIDAVGLGNHDFDLGSELLAHAINQDARFPILAANLSGCSELDNFRFPAAIFVVKGVRIGVIGLVTRAEIKLNTPECQVIDPVKVVKNLLPVIQPLCDVIIIISHLGYCLDSMTAPTLDAGDVELAMSLPYGSVNLIIGGHSHDVLNSQELSVENIVNGIPIVQAGSQGRFLGQVTMRVRDQQASVTNAHLMLTSNLPVDKKFEQYEIQPILTEARKLLSRKLGKVENDPGLSTENVVNTFAAGELTLANFISDAVVKRLQISDTKVDFAMIDSSCIRRGLDHGENFTYGDWFNLMPFADTIRIFQITGHQLYDLLLDNASRVDHPGEPHTERGFLQFSQQVRYKVYQGPNRMDIRINDVKINGVPLEMQLDSVFRLAGTSFTRELAANWEAHQLSQSGNILFNVHNLPYFETDMFLRKELVAYILQYGGVTYEGGAQCDGRLTITEEYETALTSQTVRRFVKEVSTQKHAMAGTVIAISAAQATGLGLACLCISSDQFEPDRKDLLTNTISLDEIKNSLMDWCDVDANAISEFVKLRNAGNELKGQQLLCEAPSNVARLSLKAAMILQDFRPFVNERVKDDLEMSISLLSGTAQAALLLLDSNLRIWQEKSLLDLFEPILEEIETGIGQLSVRKRIRENLIK